MAADSSPDQVVCRVSADPAQYPEIVAAVVTFLGLRREVHRCAPHLDQSVFVRGGLRPQAEVACQVHPGWDDLQVAAREEAIQQRDEQVIQEEGGGADDKRGPIVIIFYGRISNKNNSCNFAS